MKSESLWQLFCDTGDPLGWLICRAAEKSENIDGAGSEPRS